VLQNLTNLAEALERIAVVLERIITDLKQIQELKNAVASLKLTLGTPVNQ
jgi:hypothetical protein